MFEWKNWLIQTLIAAFFISGFVVFYNRGQAFLGQARARGWLAPRVGRLLLTGFTLLMVFFCLLAAHWNPINASAYTNWALYMLFIPLLDGDLVPAQFGLRAGMVLGFWLYNDVVSGPLLALSLVNLVAILVLLLTMRRPIRASWPLDLAMIAWIAIAFWLPQTQLTLVNVWANVVQFFLVNCFTLIYWTAERTAELERNQLEDQVNRDELTQIGSFFAFRSDSSVRLSIARHRGMPLTLLMFDIDRFKRVNDTYGHPTGNAVLIAVAQAVSAVLADYPQLRPTFYRTGGEEFNVIFDAPVSVVATVAQAIQAAVAATTFEAEGHTLHLTLSIGITALNQTDMTFAEVYDRADAALYRAKKAGRDRIECG